MNAQLNEMINKTKEIIWLSEQRLSSKNISDQNRLVIKAILKDFRMILGCLEENGKLLLYAPERPIITRWTIIDSAEWDNEADNKLFDKVKEYNQACSEIDEWYKLYTKDIS